MNFLARQKKLRGQLAPAGLDGLLVSHLPNIRYLCGFTGSAGFLVVRETGSVFFTDVRYDTQSRAEVKGAKVMIARKAVERARGVGWRTPEEIKRADAWDRGRTPDRGGKEASCRPAAHRFTVAKCAAARGAAAHGQGKRRVRTY